MEQEASPAAGPAESRPAPIRRRATVAQIASLAGVSTATVDRVLNERAHVGKATRQRVLQAKEAIELGTTPGGRLRPFRLKVFLPAEAGPSTEFLAASFQEVGARGNATVECVLTRKMEPAALARKLHACAGQRVNAVAFQALQDPRVVDAVEELARLGIPSLELLSGLEGARSIGYAGLNNRAAGRTAGHFMGRFSRQSGPVAIVTGGQLYASHEDREMGFRAALRQHFPHLDDVVVCSGHDDVEGNHRAVGDALRQHPGLVGIYNVGGGNEGVVRALADAGLTGEILHIGHNLTPKTHGYLLEGAMDLVLHINMRAVAEKAVEMMIAHLEKRPVAPHVFPVEVITRENIQGVTFG